MNFMKFFCLTVLVMLLLAKIAPAEEKIACGVELNQILKAICKYGYEGYQLPKKKRSELSHIPQDSDVTDIDILHSPKSTGNLVLMGKLFGSMDNSLMLRTRRRRDGIYDECCRKVCTYNEIESYCLREEDLA